MAGIRPRARETPVHRIRPTTLRRFHVAGFRPCGSLFRHRRGRVRSRSRHGRTIPRCSSCRISRWSRDPVFPSASFRFASRRLPRGCAASSPATSSPLDLFDRRTDCRRVIHCNPSVLVPTASRSPAWSRPRFSNTLSSTDFTKTRRNAPHSTPGRRIVRQAGCMAETEKRRKSRLLAAAHHASRRAAEDKQGDRPRGARPAEGGGVHGLLS